MLSVKSFTLIEVIIAIGILAISLASLFQIIASSRARIAKAEESWHNMHMLTQAAEYVLLHRAEMVDDVDKEFFPYEDYQVNISFEEVLDEQIDEGFRSGVALPESFAGFRALAAENVIRACCICTEAVTVYLV